MRLCKLLFAGCLSVLSLASQAETVKGLYQVREPVSSQAPRGVLSTAPSTRTCS